MKEIDPIAETDYTVETECTTEIGHTVGIDHDTHIKMTIEVTTEMITEMTIEKEIIRISKTRDIGENIKVIIKTHMTRITIELAMETRIGAKIDNKTKTDTEMTAMAKLEVGLNKKTTYMMMMIYLIQKLKECTKFYK